MELYAKIDYENIPEKSNSIRNEAREINTKLIKIYKEIEEMRVSWYGERYNELVEKFNQLVPQLNQFLDVIVAQVPYIFDTVANKISDLDIEQNITNARKDSYKKITEIKKAKDNGMRFISTEVENTRISILKEFQEINDEMERIKKNVANIGIECEGSEGFKTQFDRLAYSFETVIKNIATQFDNLMEKDKEMMEEAEKKNKGK